VDVRALRYFVETVKCANFTAAARNLFVTQSTVSKMVKQLEDELETQLLIREGHTARPTDVGRLVHARAVPILAAMDSIKTEVAQLTQLERGELVIGIPPMINLLFGAVVKAFRARYPAIQLRLIEVLGPEVEERVHAGELEIGATILPMARTGQFDVHPVGQYDLWAVGPKSADWAGREQLSFKTLSRFALLTPTDDFGMMRHLRAVFDAQRAPLTIAAQSAHWDFLVAMASADLGVALIPEPLLARLQTDELALARVVRPTLAWQVAHVTAKNRYLSFAAQAWLDMTKHLSKQHFAPLQRALPGRSGLAPDEKKPNLS